MKHRKGGVKTSSFFFFLEMKVKMIYDCDCSDGLQHKRAFGQYFITVQKYL